MQIIFSEEFKKDFKKVKDKSTRIRVINHLKKLGQLPESGKPLQYHLRGHRCIRVPPFRIIYRIEQDRIIILCFDHRKDVYK
ncbi:type II toxin-antitoxin system RelE/ParE family toxin [archaeon]|nr:type II toxin-antitoxin system RelE/ParE family toxin [archaeon]